MLDGVTIHGKLVVRGGADAVQMTGCTIADGITLTNPNAVTHIVVQDSQTGVLEVRSGLTLEGGHLRNRDYTNCSSDRSSRHGGTDDRARSS